MKRLLHLAAVAAAGLCMAAGAHAAVSKVDPGTQAALDELSRLAVDRAVPVAILGDEFSAGLRKSVQDTFVRMAQEQLRGMPDAERAALRNGTPAQRRAMVVRIMARWAEVFAIALVQVDSDEARTVMQGVAQDEQACVSNATEAALRFTANQTQYFLRVLGRLDAAIEKTSFETPALHVEIRVERTMRHALLYPSRHVPMSKAVRETGQAIMRRDGTELDEVSRCRLYAWWARDTLTHDAAEITADARALLHQTMAEWYAAMGQQMARALQAPPAPTGYPPFAAAFGVTGRTTVTVRVDDQGQPSDGDVTAREVVVPGLPPGPSVAFDWVFDDISIENALSRTYEPAPAGTRVWRTIDFVWRLE